MRSWLTLATLILAPLSIAGGLAVIRPGHSEQGRPSGSAYILPAAGQVVAGFSELNVNGYRERGIRLTVHKPNASSLQQAEQSLLRGGTAAMATS